MTEIDVGMISGIANLVILALSPFIVKYVNKLRFLRDLSVCLINAIDDHEISEEEVDDIIEKIENLT